MSKPRVTTMYRFRADKIAAIGMLLGLCACKETREPVAAQASSIAKQEKSGLHPSPSATLQQQVLKLTRAQQALVDGKVRSSFGAQVRGTVLDIRRSGPWLLIAGEMVDSSGTRVKPEALSMSEDEAPIDNVFFGLFNTKGESVRLVEWSAGATDMPVVDWLEKHELPRSMLP